MLASRMRQALQIQSEHELLAAQSKVVELTYHFGCTLPKLHVWEVRQEKALVESAQRQLVLIECDENRRTTYPGRRSQ